MTTQLPLFDPNARPPVPDQPIEAITIDKDHASSPEELMPGDGLLRVTNNYSIPGQDVGRLLRVIEAKQNVEGRKIRAELSSEMGLPEERVRSLLTIVRKADMITNQTRLTPFGTFITQYDPFLLNSGLQWFCHFLFSSNAHLFIWSHLFNSAFYKINVLSPSDIVEYFMHTRGGMKVPTFQENGGKELGSLLRTYTDEWFRSLRLVIRADKGKYEIINGPHNIPPYFWLASLLVYRDRYYPGAATLETHLLVDAHFSPGRLFRQDGEAVRKMLDGLHNRSLLTVESRLGLDQVRFKGDITWLAAVAAGLQEGR